MTKRKTGNQGFTLMESLFVVVILAVLLTIALPTYQGFMNKSRRTDAMNSLLRMQVEQEKWRGSDTDYGTLAEIWSGSDSLESYYTLAVTVNTAAAFTLTAAPRVGGPQEGDDCGTFAVNQTGPLYTGYANADCWGR
jgi:type IV pilus assembly protein PilE